MAIRLKDRIEANIRQSDKVNNSLSIQLNSGTATVYNGSEAKSINITPAAINAVKKNGDTMSGRLYNTLASGKSGEFTATRGDVSVWLGIGSGDVNHGIYSGQLSDWMVYSDGTSVTLNGNATSATYAQTTNTNSTNRTLYPVGTTTSSTTSAYTLYKDSDICYITKNGAAATDTASAVQGYALLVLGNSTDYEAAGGARGAIRLYAPNSYYIDIRPEVDLSANRALCIPALGGTRYIVNSSTRTALGGANQPVYLAAEGLATACNTFVPNTGGTFTGTVIFSHSTDAAGTKNNKPALIIGGTDTEPHIEIDNNEIIAKANGTSLAEFWIEASKMTFIGAVTTSTTITANSSINTYGSYYIKRNPLSTCYIVFQRNANHTSESFVSGDYSYVLKANGAAEMAQIYYAPSYAATRTTTADGTVNSNYTSRGSITFRTYSMNSSTGARLSYYYRYYLYPIVPNDLTESKSFYIMTQTNSSISSSTSKRYVMGITEANGAVNYNASVYTSGSVLYGACWNDYAEYRSQNELLIAGHITYCDDDGKLKYTTERLQKFEGVVSDTFGFSIGETDDCKTPLAVSGRVLVYCDPEDHFHSGDCVCAGPDGKAYRMTREEITMYPDRIVGVVSEIPTYERWGTGNVEVNGRIWIKVK